MPHSLKIWSTVAIQSNFVASACVRFRILERKAVLSQAVPIWSEEESAKL